MAITENAEGAFFPGTIGRTTDESSPAWPAATRPAVGAPNVVVVVLDDTGFPPVLVLRYPPTPK